MVLASASGATIGRGKAVGTIVNDDLAVGVTELSPAEARAEVGETIQNLLTWTHPETWRTFETIDLRIGDDRSTIIWIRFTETPGETKGTFRLVDPRTGRLGEPGVPGSPGTLGTNSALLSLADSAVTAAGPTAPSVTLTYSLTFRQPAARRTYRVEVFAADDRGFQQGWDPIGTLTLEKVRGRPGAEGARAKERPAAAGRRLLGTLEALRLRHVTSPSPDIRQRRLHRLIPVLVQCSARGRA